MKPTRRIAALGALVLGVASLLLAGIAAADNGGKSSGKPNPAAMQAAVIADAAKQLNVTSDELTSALRTAVSDQVDQMVSDGKLTSEQASKLKAQLAKAPLIALPLPPKGDKGGRGQGGPGGGKSGDGMCPNPSPDGKPSQGSKSGNGVPGDGGKGGSGPGAGRGGCNPGLGQGGKGGSGGPGDGGQGGSGPGGSGGPGDGPGAGAPGGQDGGQGH